MLNFFSSVFVLIILAACNSSAEKLDNTITSQEAIEFVERYDSAWKERDTNLMKKLMDDQYIYFNSAGTTRSRSNLLSWFTPADKYKADKSNRSEIVISINGNVAIVSSRWIGSGTFGNEKFNDDQRCGLVLQKSNGVIRLIAENCTQITR